MAGFRTTNNAVARGRAVAWLRALTRAGNHPLVRKLYGMVPLRWKNALRARLVMRATGAAALQPVLPPAGSTARPGGPVLRAPAPDNGPGVNLIGFAHGGLGLSENFRGLARALLAQGYPVALVDAGVLDDARNKDRPTDLSLADSCPFAIDVVCINPDQFGRAMTATQAARRADAYRIGYWFWELERVPAAWMSAIDDVDEIWVASEFVRGAFAAVTAKPVTLVRMPVQPPQLPAVVKGDADPFVFIFSFDFHSYVARKNPSAVIEAFRRAFPNGDESVRLILKSNNGDAFRDQLYALMGTATDDARIEIRDGYIDRNDMLDLLARADAYVSLHRSEGFGLGMAEAMALGKAVVGTGYSGNLDFMRDDNSRLVRYELVPTPEGAYMHDEGGHWAEPDIDDAARIMREFADDRANAASIGLRAAAHMRAAHSLEVAGSIAMQRLEGIRASRALPANVTPSKGVTP